MKKTAKRLSYAVILFVVCLALGFLTLACGDDDKKPGKPAPTPPVKVADGIDFDLAVGKTKTLTVADYITVNDYTATASASNANVTAEVLSTGLLQVTAVTVGESVVTLSCETVEVTFNVTVNPAPVTYTVTVDGEVKATLDAGSEYTLPDAVTPEDPDMKFVGWRIEGGELKQPGDKITVDSNVVITAETELKAAEEVKKGEAISLSMDGTKTKVITVADYITTHGREVAVQSSDGTKATAALAEDKLTVTVTAVAVGTTTVTIACGDVQITFAVEVTAAPVTCTVTVDGEVKATLDAGSEYTLPAAVTPEDTNFEFVGWQIVGGELKQPGDKITVDANVVITAEFETKAAEIVKQGEDIALVLGETETSEKTVADYITTYGREVSASATPAGIATVAVSEGTLTVTAVSVGSTTVTLACGSVNVTFAVTVTSATDKTPVFSPVSITYDLAEKASESVDFVKTAPDGTNFTYEYALAEADACASIADDTLTYTATEAVSKTLTVNVTATDETVGEKTTSFTVTVSVTDTRVYRMDNGDFENGLTGWTLSNAELGEVNDATVYWDEHRKPFNAVGKFFNAYTNILEKDDLKIAQDGNEGAKGTLTSSKFKVGGSGFITYRFGGGKDMSLVYIEVIEDGTNAVLERFGNKLFNAEDNNGCALIAYKANLSALDGKTVYIRITDNASANYGLFFVDEFVTYYEQEPADYDQEAGTGFNLAVSQAYRKYEVANGGFENGNLDGWTLTRLNDSVGDFAAVTNDSKYFDDNSDYGKDGAWLFSGADSGNNGTNPWAEDYMGVLKSDNFILKANTWISFKLGGGNHSYLGIRIKRADNNEVIARFQNTALKAGTPEGNLIQYVFQFEGMTEDVECYVEIFDEANTAGDGWRLVTVDSIVTYYAQAPQFEEGKYENADNQVAQAA